MMSLRFRKCTDGPCSETGLLCLSRSTLDADPWYSSVILAGPGALNYGCTGRDEIDLNVVRASTADGRAASSCK